MFAKMRKDGLTMGVFVALDSCHVPKLGFVEISEEEGAKLPLLDDGLVEAALTAAEAGVRQLADLILRDQVSNSELYNLVVRL